MYFEKGNGDAVFGLRACLQECDVARVYDEVERRMLDLYKEGLWSSKELREERVAMTQGIYSAMMVIADNWPEVRAACDREESRRNWWHLD